MKRFFTRILQADSSVLGLPYYASTRDIPEGRIVGRRRNVDGETWDLVIRAPDGQMFERKRIKYIKIPIEEVTMPDEDIPKKPSMSKEDARELFRQGLQQDMERQDRGEGDYPVAGDPEPGPTPKPPDAPVFPAGAGRTEGGTHMSGNPLEIAKARLIGVSNELNNIRGAIRGQVDSLDGKARVLLGAYATIEERLVYLTTIVRRLEEEKAVAIMATAGHSVAAPTRVLHQIDVAINEVNEAIGRVKSAMAQVDTARKQIALATANMEKAITITSAAMAEMDSYRTSF